MLAVPATSAALRQNDPRLEHPGIVVNGQPSLLAEGDEKLSCVRIRCAGKRCGNVVGLVWLHLPADVGRPPFYFAELDAVFRLDPPEMRIVRLRLETVQTVLADCPAHGRIEIDTSTLIEQARRASMKNNGQTATVNARPIGEPIGHDLESTALTINEFRARWREKSEAAERRRLAEFDETL